MKIATKAFNSNDYHYDAILLFLCFNSLNLNSRFHLKIKAIIFYGRIHEENIFPLTNQFLSFFNFQSPLMQVKCICISKVNSQQPLKIYNIEHIITSTILQGLGVGPGSATERWPSRKIARK